jgi:hypothetical protein
MTSGKPALNSHSWKGGMNIISEKGLKEELLRQNYLHLQTIMISRI